MAGWLGPPVGDWHRTFGVVAIAAIIAAGGFALAVGVAFYKTNPLASAAVIGPVGVGMVIAIWQVYESIRKPPQPPPSPSWVWAATSAWA